MNKKTLKLLGLITIFSLSLSACAKKQEKSEIKEQVKVEEDKEESDVKEQAKNEKKEKKELKSKNKDQKIETRNKDKKMIRKIRMIITRIRT
ncbi:MAG: hypothetical protein Q4E50_02460 [Tissierellia bacterium]|nr:hypothetical protein [Tissierellia bacterium]